MMTKGVETIAAQREKIGTFADFEANGISIKMGEFALAAACYAMYSAVGLIPFRIVRDNLIDVIKNIWPFPNKFSPGDRLNSLALAGAYIAAEIDRVLALQGEV